MRSQRSGVVAKNLTAPWRHRGVGTLREVARRAFGGDPTPTTDGLRPGAVRTTENPITAIISHGIYHVGTRTETQTVGAGTDLRQEASTQCDCHGVRSVGAEDCGRSGTTTLTTNVAHHAVNQQSVESTADIDSSPNNHNDKIAVVIVKPTGSDPAALLQRVRVVNDPFRSEA